MFESGTRIEMKLVAQTNHLVGYVSVTAGSGLELPLRRTVTCNTRDGLDELWESLDAVLAAFAAEDLWEQAKPEQLFAD